MSVVGKQGFDDLGRKIADKPVGAINRMEYALGRYQEMSRSVTNPAIIEKYNRKIEETSKEVTRLGNIGKAGFDGMGNAIQKNKSALGGMWSGLKTIANILPGLGIAGLLAFATTPILKYIASLGIFKAKIDSVLEARKQFNEAMLKGTKDAQSEITQVRTLYSNYQNTNISLNKRKAIYKELQAAYPAYFGNIAFEEKATNKTKAAYDNLTNSIIATARARALGDKITENESKKLDNEEKIKLLEAKKREEEIAAIKNKRGRENSLDTQQRLAFDKAAKDRAEGAKQLQQEITKARKENELIDAENARYDAEITNQIKKGAKITENKPTPDNKDHKKELDARLSREKTLMAEITKIRMDASRKQLESQAAELQGITDEYDLITKKVQDFFVNPKNKGTKLSLGQVLYDLTKAEEQERAAITKKYQDQEEKEAKEHLDDLLKKYATFEDRKKAIIAETEKEVAELRGKGYYEQAVNAEKAGEDRISEVDEEAIKSLAAYKNLFDNIGEISRAETLKRIANLREELKNFKGSAEAKAKLIAELNKLERGINEDNGKDSEDKEKKRIKELNEALTALRLISTEFDNLNDSLGAAASFLLNSAKAYFEIKEQISTITDKDKSTTEKVAAGAGIIGAALGVANAVVGYFKGLKAAKEAAQKAMSEFHQAAIKGERDYQELLRKRDLDTVARGKSTYQAIIAQLELLKKQSPEIQKAYEKVYAALQGQSMVEGIGYKHGTWLRKAKTWDIMASLAGSDYNKLEKLYTEGKLKDQAKADFEALRNLREEMEAAGLSVQSLQDQLKSLLTGTNASGLADSLTQLFQNGKFAAKDFGDSFEEIMKNAIVNSFKYKVMEDAMKPFYDEFAALFLNGTPSATDIDALKAKYEAIGIQMGDQFKELEKITGRSLTNSDTAGTGNTMSGAISSIRAEQADLLASRLGGIQISNIEMLAIQKQKLDLQRQCYLIAVDTLNNIIRIESNTYRTAENTEHLKKLVEIDGSLKEIKKNMNSDALAASGLRGFGG